jgi:ribonuclease HI
MEDNNMLLSKQFKKINLDHASFIKKLDKKTLICFSDGSCTGNGKKSSVGGYALLWVNGFKHGDITLGKVPDKDIPATNIRAEYYGIKTYLDYLKKDIKNKEWDSAILYSDSEFWIKMIERYMPKWNKYQFETKANPDLTIPLWALWNELQSSNKSICIKHIYAHNKDNSATSHDKLKVFQHDNNKLVDELATMARKIPDYKVVCLKL